MTASVSNTGLDSSMFDAIVIGGSAGVLEVLRIVLAAAPQNLSIPVAIVVHLPPRPPGLVHEVLQHVSALSMQQAEDKQPLQGGTIYFAPPGYHLLIESRDTMALSIDEPVHYSRPSIDVLFESASEVYANRLLGILLTGASNDGAAGLLAIHDAGGVTVVQDPQSCEAATMPRAAMALFEPDHVLTPSAIGHALLSLGAPDAQGRGVRQ